MENFYLSQGIPAMAFITSDSNNYPIWYLYYEATNKDLNFMGKWYISFSILFQ